MSNKKIAIFISFMFVTSCIALVASLPASDAAEGDFETITVTNSIGTSVTFTEPAQKAASMGISFTTTLIELGCIDAVVMLDVYSKPSNSGISELDGYSSTMYYSLGNGEQVAQLLANGMGGFNKDRDVVFVYGYSYNSTAITNMEALGLKVVTFYPKTYEAGMDMVMKIGGILGFKNKASEVKGEMETAKDNYAQKIADMGISDSQKVKALYVSYSLGVIKVGNVDSYSVILLKLVGGVNPADDSTKTGTALTSYQVDDTIFLQLRPDVIFLDPNYTGTPSDFRTEKHLGDSVKIYKLSMTMNQYGPTSMDGMEFMAEAMYPETVGSVDSGNNPDDGGDIWIYAGAGIAVVLLIAVVAYVLLRR